jgi:hypothetical protein
MEKSANQLFRESGTSLSFADWIEREKNKGVAITNKLLEDIVAPYANVEEEEDKLFILSKSSLGIPNWVIITGISVIGFTLIYKYLYKAKK